MPTFLMSPLLERRSKYSKCLDFFNFGLFKCLDFFNFGLSKCLDFFNFDFKLL